VINLLDVQTIHGVMDMLVNGINPVLFVVILMGVLSALSSATPATRAASLRRALWLCAVGCVAIAVPVVFAEVGKRYVVWQGHSGFPSGHTTFAASASAVIVAYRGKPWLLLAVPATALMMFALVYLRYHETGDVFGGLLLGAGVGALMTRLLVRPRVADIPPSHDKL